jgi:hypothetical protein
MPQQLPYSYSIVSLSHLFEIMAHYLTWSSQMAHAVMLHFMLHCSCQAQSELHQEMRRAGRLASYPVPFAVLTSSNRGAERYSKQQSVRYKTSLSARASVNSYICVTPVFPKF